VQLQIILNDAQSLTNSDFLMEFFLRKKNITTGAKFM
jgi:hypothetical protein